jgi:methionyl-tRNA formyltransferase
MNKIKVVFFGTSDRSTPILEALKNNFDLVLCVTKKDTQVGRHMELKETGVKIWAKENGVKVLSISSLKGMELEDLIEQLKGSNVEFGLVADFSFIVPLQLIEFFQGKLINIHFSLLPSYRGACPVQFAILNGDDTTGITYYLMDRKMDTGKIIHQIGYKMAGNETSGQLYSVLFGLAAENLPKVINEYKSGLLVPRVQDEDKATYTYSPTHPDHTFIYKEDAQINWKKPAGQIERAVRAFNPWPICWTTAGELENNKKLWAQKLTLKTTADKKARVKLFSVEVTGDKKDKINIYELQPEGKNKMTWESFENGYVEA